MLESGGYAGFNQSVGWEFDVAGIFINYRGEDSRSYAALLYVELSRLFGADEVFLDSESIPAGTDFVERLLSRVRAARTVLAVIGPRWLAVADDHGRRRIDQPDDWIRRELAEAFRAGVTVIPVLTDNARGVGESDLPADIARLARCQYRRLRHLDARADLARLVNELRASDTHLTIVARQRSGVPQQLPAAAALFVGRETELAALDAISGESPTDVAVCAITGTGGMGKTWLALHWAQRNAGRYPDGQLFVNLRGYDPSGEPVAPTAVLHDFLVALGVEPAAIPVDVEAQVSWYRSVLAERRVLVVLDNAADSAQVMPLLPTGAGSAALVTSRTPLLGLVTAHGARSLPLDVLAADQARAVLTRRLGTARLAAEPGAAAELLDTAAGLPLALAIMAARAAAEERLPLTVLADELRDHTARLDALDTGEVDLSLRATLSWSSRGLSPAAATVFALLGRAPGPDIGLHAAANLAGQSAPRTGVLLRELTAAQLVHRHRGNRYRMHDLVRLYAGELAAGLPHGVVAGALRRVVGFYLRTAFAADRVLAPHTAPIEVTVLSEDHQPLAVPDMAGAWDWFDAEHPCLIAAQRVAAAWGWPDAVWQLAWTLDTYHYRRGKLDDDLGVWQIAAASTEHVADPAARNLVLRHLGQAYAMAARCDDALRHLREALAIAESGGDLAGQAHTHRAIWRVCAQQDRHDLALDHARRALPLYLRLDNPVWLAEATNQVGWSYGRLGRYEEAVRYCREALTLCQRHSHHDGEARTLVNLGQLAYQSGADDAATAHLERALVLYRQLANSYDEAQAWETLGTVSARRGQRARAVDALRTALTLYQDQGRAQDSDRVQGLLDNLD